MLALVFGALAATVAPPASGHGQICLARPFNTMGSAIHWHVFTSAGEAIGQLRNGRVLCFDRDPGRHSIEVHIRALVADGAPFALERSLIRGKKHFSRAAKVSVASGDRLVLQVHFDTAISFEQKSQRWLERKRLRPTALEHLSREERLRQQGEGG